MHSKSVFVVDFFLHICGIYSIVEQVMKTEQVLGYRNFLVIGSGGIYIYILPYVLFFMGSFHVTACFS